MYEYNVIHIARQGFLVRTPEYCGRLTTMSPSPHTASSVRNCPGLIVLALSHFTDKSPPDCMSFLLANESLQS